jgi:hypothetical protein
MKNEKLSSRALAAEIGVSHTAVQRARRRGVPDSQIIAAAQSATATPDSEGISAAEFQQDVRREQRAKAERREFELAIRRGEFSRVDEFRRIYGGAILTARDRFLQMPGSLAPILALESDPAVCAEILRRAIYDALTEVSRYASLDKEN